jgi:hypothetical protein
MLHVRAWIVLLALGSLAGCASEDPLRSTVWRTPEPAGAASAGSDLIQLQVAILEVPVGDGYLNEELWGLANEQQLSPDQRTHLRANGFRVGQVRGITPPGLQALLTSERNNPAPHMKQLRAGESCTLDVGPAMDSCRFLLRDDGPASPVQESSAQFAFQIVPTLTDEGNVRLRIQPQIGHDNGPAHRAGEVPLWMVLTKRPVRRFENLAWEVTLEPNEYVLIGGRLEPTDSIGCASFVRPEEANAVQRLLVIRTSRVRSEIPLDDVRGAASNPLVRRPPLALQAAWSALRGCVP